MRLLGVSALLVLSVTACAPQPASEGSPMPSGTATEAPPAASPTIDAVVAVEAALYSTEMGSGDRTTFDGVDFDSPDGNLHCGIFSPSYDFIEAPAFGCFADSVDFEWPVVANDGSADLYANSIAVQGAKPAKEMWISDVSYAGQFPQDYPNLKRLENGQSITWTSVTCTALDDGITCINAASGHGFDLSRARYQVF